MGKIYLFLKIWLLVLSWSISCVAQEIVEIEIICLKVDEPPTVPAPSPQIIVYKKSLTGDFTVAKTVGFSKHENAQVKKSRLEKESVVQLDHWLTLNKREFNFLELEVDFEDVNEELAKAPLTFIKDVNLDYVLRPDSSRFCVQNAAVLMKAYTTGGSEMEVSVKRKGQPAQTFGFSSSGFKSHHIDLATYFTFAPLLIKSLPRTFAERSLFTYEKLKEGILYHLKYIECEGYYYGEFLKQHPNRTPAENRAMKGWNFQEYLQNHPSRN